VIDVLARPATGSDNNIESIDCLTNREQEILSLIAEGYANIQIAEALSIAEGTIKNHVVNIYQKLDLHSRAEAVAWAWQHNIIK
jgi:DNA-binding NarL/FixJ family response regulator